MPVFTCRYFVSSPEEMWGPHEQALSVEFPEAALVVTNIYGLLLDESHPARQWQAKLYGDADVRRREAIAQGVIVPLLQAARSAGMPVVYVADSAPNIALEHTYIREAMIKHLGIDPLEAHAESGNDQGEYVRGDVGRIAYAPALEPQQSDYYVRKWIYNGFYASWLDRLLRDLRSQVLFFAGFNGDSDLLCTMLGGHWAGYRVVLVRGGQASVHIPEAEPEMDFTQRMELFAEGRLGFTISATDFVSACSSGRSGS